MESKQPANSTNIAPPRLIPTIISGFNVVANHVYLILFPVALDLFLWLGPRARIKTLLQPFVNDIIRSLAEVSAPELSDLIKMVETVWQITLERYNIFTALRTYPIGIPSLFASVGSLKTPIGDASIFEMPSITSAIATWILMGLTGIMFGSIYFNEIARSASKREKMDSIASIGKKYLQVVFFTLALIFLLLIISIPISFLLTIAAMINPLLSQIILVVITVSILWLIFPLVFSVHGIFVFEQNILISTLNSVRLVRFFLPGTGLFVLTVLFVSRIMDMLWRTAPETSWMALVGIFGHAFINTSLIAASFVYYLSGMRWMEHQVQNFAMANQAKV
ncbi:MAG: hypothetical protein HPY45_08060 [Anaerolineae bacterium]|nr:hypothetical protein [Anaerolineae bacterium]